jgi:predicted O-methyltransferase YrrM
VLYLLREREHDYVAVTDQIADNSLDFALVDGMGRDKCALRLRQKLKPGGILILDNANWFLPCSTRSPASINIKSSAATDDWIRFNESVAKWRSIWTTNGVWDTALWVKPS